MPKSTCRTLRVALLAATVLTAHVVTAQTTTSVSAGVAAAAADADVFSASEPAREYKSGKIVHARRIIGTPPTIDGRLDDEIWVGGDAATGFVQRDPQKGK